MTEAIGNAARGGDLAWVRLGIASGRVVEASGEGTGVAELCRAVRGLTTLAAGAVPGATLAADALHDALGRVVTGTPDARRVAVAMSGGVDSAVALLRVRDAGNEPVGVTLRLWTDPAGSGGDRACCSPASVVAARETCHELGVPHFTLDLREAFRGAVVGPFVEGYARGETPNPCVRCNGSFRFAALLAFARRVGAKRLATGHYARIGEHRGRLLLKRGVDAAKDQSYMLARVEPSRLAHVWFPLGDQAKAATREQAREAGLAVADRRESQEACFLAGDDYRDFLARRGLEARDGSLVDERGRELGRHEGFWRFTPGQRRGLGLSTPMPLYTLATEAGTNTVVVGPRESLARTTIGVRGGRLYLPVGRGEVKLRYRSPAVPAAVIGAGDEFRLELETPAYGVAVGQTAVLYDDDAVVGAGAIAFAS
jgi:tRNA-uridine 2-sulfurtransferase